MKKILLSFTSLSSLFAFGRAGFRSAIIRQTRYCALLLAAFVPSYAVAQEFAGYLFAYFEGGGDTKQMEQLRFAVSEDAKNWYALNGNRPIIASDTISTSGGIRDPHILRGEDGDYYIVATDMYTYDPKQG